MIVGLGILCRVVPLTFILCLGQLRLIERFRTVETVKTVAIETVETVEINRKETLKAKCRIGLDGWLRLTAMTPRASLQSYATYSVETEQKKF